MANRVLGIEYSADRIKIVEASFGRKLKIFNFAVVDNRGVDPARRTEHLNHTLQARGFEARDGIIAASGGTTEHRLLTLPPLSIREMHFVMQREANELAAATGTTEMLWSYDVLKTKEELGIKKNQILLVTAERPVVAAAQNLTAQSRVKLQQVTTIPEAVLNLLRQVAAWKEDAVRPVIYFAGTGVYIMFTQDATLLLSREVHFDSAGMVQEEQAERLNNELRRSMLFFRQNFPQAQMDQIVFSGDSDLLSSLAMRSSEELGVPGSILQFEDNLDMSAFRGDRHEFRVHLPFLTAALGAAWRKRPGASGINLLPGKTKAKPEAVLNPTKIAGVACILAASIALIVGVYDFRGRYKIDAARRELTQQAAGIEPKHQQLVQIETAGTASEPESSLTPDAIDKLIRPEAIAEVAAPPPPGALTESPNLPIYSVTGIVAGEQGRWAIVDGHLLRRGERIGTETLKEVKDSAVVLEHEGRLRELPLKNLEDTAAAAPPKKEAKP